VESGPVSGGESAEPSLYAKLLEAAETAFDDIAGFAELASKAGGLPSAFDRAVRDWPSDRPFPN
jgi:hypothetical protein